MGKNEIKYKFGLVKSIPKSKIPVFSMTHMHNMPITGTLDFFNL